MSDKKVVEIVSYFTLKKVPYKYAHRDVLISVSTLFYDGRSKSMVYYQVCSSIDCSVQIEDISVQIEDLVDSAFSWVYGSLKSSKFTLRQSFIFDTSVDLKKKIQTTIKNYTKVNNLKMNYAINYVLIEVESEQQFSEVEEIFGFKTILPLAIVFNFSGFYEVSLKDLSIIKMNDIKFMS